MLELGAGKSGLAGLSVAACCSPASVALTDGNSANVASLHEAVAANRHVVYAVVILLCGEGIMACACVVLFAR